MTVEQPETNRARVRRLLIEPLAEMGMRFKHGTQPDVQAATLNRFCDDLAYASDETLRGVFEFARRNGQGSGRTFWPERVALLSVAHAIEPVPFEEQPVLSSWFGSNAGPVARKEGRLVAEFCFMQQKLRPPGSDREWAAIRRRAEDYARRIELAEDRQARDVSIDEDERRFLDWYRSVEVRAEKLIAQGEDKRANAGAAA